MSEVLLLDGTPATPPGTIARTGIVRCERRVVRDDTGVFHPLGLTFFWALYGWKYEREKVLAHLKWLAPKKIDYLRILGEVDWTGRSIEPSWQDYAATLQGFVDAAYDYGLRSEVTIVGGRQYDKDTGAQRFIPSELAAQVATALHGRESKVMHYECANEWNRLDKVGPQDLVDMARVLVAQTPNLVSLSTPQTSANASEADLLAEDKDSSLTGAAQMKALTKAAGANAFTIHPRRSSHDSGWSHVRQGYDFKDFDTSVWNNEGEGPQSSVVPMDNPLQLACCRLLGILCGGAGYVLHVGQGVTGEADLKHGRPEFMWQVPNIDHIMEVVRGVDILVPDGIENWQCVNNARDAHPLPLPPNGFWEGSHGVEGVNKNYAAINGADWRVIHTGVRSRQTTGLVHVGTAKQVCHVEAYDPARAYLGLEAAHVATAELTAGQRWELRGRADTMAAYLIVGRYL
jgi:hypothetical protein